MKGSNFEKKFIDTNVTDDITTTAVVTPINLLATGTDANNRIGRKIEMKSVQVRSYLTLEANSINCARLMIVYDKQPNKATASITDILVSSSVTSLLNMDGRDRFIVLHDEEVVMDNAQGDSAYIKIYKKLKLETVYNSTATATDTAVNTGMLLWCVVGSTAAGSSDIDQNTNIRVRYIDG